MFLNRKKELALLDEILHRKGAQFVVVYGRRRIGKTALLNHWLETSVKGAGVYWVAHRTSAKILLDDFSAALAGTMNSEGGGFSFSSWEAAFKQVAQLAEKKRTVLVVDEFPYLVEAVPSISSMLQALWDHVLSKSQVMLIVCGSHFHMMRKELLTSSGPLYGRTTAGLYIDEIAPAEIRKFLGRYSTTQIVETYSVIGGVPKYLEMWDDSKPVMKNIEQVLLSPATIFRQEPAFLIQDELPEARTYLAILEAIGSGDRSPKAIGEKCGIPLTHVGKYLNTLQNLAFVRRTVSIDADNPVHSRMSIYEINDAFLNFYFAMIQQFLALIDQNRTRKILEEIKERFNVFVARNGFEQICRKMIMARGDEGELPFQPIEVGRLWNRSVEIDVAAIDQKSQSVLLGECKWTERPVSYEILKELRRKAELLKSIAHYKKHFALFSKARFTKELTEKAKREDVMLFSIMDMGL